MLVGEGGGEHRYQARPICDSQIAIVDTVTYYFFTLIVSKLLRLRASEMDI